MMTRLSCWLKSDVGITRLCRRVRTSIHVHVIRRAPGVVCRVSVWKHEGAALTSREVDCPARAISTNMDRLAFDAWLMQQEGREGKQDSR